YNSRAAASRADSPGSMPPPGVCQKREPGMPGSVSPCSSTLVEPGNPLVEPGPATESPARVETPRVPTSRASTITRAPRRRLTRRLLGASGMGDLGVDQVAPTVHEFGVDVGLE